MLIYICKIFVWFLPPCFIFLLKLFVRIFRNRIFEICNRKTKIDKIDDFLHIFGRFSPVF